MNPARRPPRRRGVTLVETVAALVIIATLVGMALAAQSRLTRQWSEADLRVKAADIADGLLTVWWDADADLPHRDSGDVPDHPGWRWRTAPLEDRPLLRDRLEVVRLMVYAPPSSGYGHEPLAQIDVMTRLDRGGETR